MTVKTLNVNEFDLNYSSLIEASAGTGKTYTISYLVVRLLLGCIDNTERTENLINEGKPLDIENLLVVTFTNAAASDLRARILEKIQYVRRCFEKLLKGKIKVEDIEEDALRVLVENYLHNCSDKDVKTSVGIRLLKRAERTIDDAAICTIHSFCNKALNQVYAFESGRAFNVNLVQDTSVYENKALSTLQRELFYFEDDDKDSKNFSKNLYSILRCDNVKDAIKAYMSDLLSVKELDERKGYFGYTVNTDSLYKGSEKKYFNDIKKRLSYLIDEAVSLAENEKNSEDIKTLFSLYEDAKLSGDVNSFIVSDLGKLQKITEKTKLLLKLLSESAPSDLNLFKFYEEIKKVVKHNTKSFTTPASLVRDDFVELLNSVYSAGLSFMHQTGTLQNEIKVLLSIMYNKKVKTYCLSDNVISNDELLIQLAAALTKDKERSERLAQQIRSRYKVAMIDEFQDTDPVQFEIFNKLYLSDEAKAAKVACYLIGDPKQSIYAFRGSDINSYNKAKANIQSNKLLDNSSPIYTLDKNFRSATNVIKGVNEVFGNSLSGNKKEEEFNPFDYYIEPNKPKSGIFFTDVNCPNENGLNGTKNFYFEDEKPKDENETKESQSNYIINVRDDSKLNALKKVISSAVAFDVQRCLATGWIREKNGNYRHVFPSDIAILVSKEAENNEIQSALNAVGIKSVYFSDKSSVLNKKIEDFSKKDAESKIEISVEAQNILYFMEAMCDSANVAKVNRLLGSSLLCKDYYSYQKAIETQNFDDEILLLRECFEKWNNSGFLSAFSYFVKEHNLIQDTMLHITGERELSNYFQIAEMVQNVNASVVGANAQLIWLTEQIFNNDENDLSKDEQKKRLESEQELVKIYTIHKSKGLQYPLVFLPFIHLSIGTKTTGNEKKKEFGFCYYDEKLHKKAFAVANVKTENGEFVKDLSQLVNNQERARLLYVALTRAQSANFIYLAPWHKQNEDGILSLETILRYSTEEKKKNLSTSPIFKELKLITKDSKEPLDYTLENLAKSDLYDIFDGKLDHLEKTENFSEIKVNSLDEDSINSSFTITSYSGLTSGAHSNKKKITDEASLADESEDKENPLVLEKVNDLSNEFRFKFTKGSKAGDLLHKYLELLLSDDGVSKDLKDSIETFVNQNKKYDSFNLMGKYSQNTDGVEQMANWLFEIVHSPLFNQSEKAYSLSDLRSTDCACELEFFMPCLNFDMKKFNALCDEFCAETVKRYSLKNNIVLGDLSRADFDGYIKGSIDLLARFKTEDSYKYFLIDYKSNHIGNTFEAYEKTELLNRYFESRYDVQTLIYALAVHRFLKTSDASYGDGSKEAYEELVGGAMYLFVRGLSSKVGADNVSYGVLNIQVPYEIVMKLDRLFNGE